MTWREKATHIVYLAGEGARPFAIIFLAASIGCGLFVPYVTVEKIVAIGAIFSGLIAARHFENTTQIRADAGVKTAAVEKTVAAADAKRTVEEAVRTVAETELAVDAGGGPQAQRAADAAERTADAAHTTVKTLRKPAPDI